MVNHNIKNKKADVESLSDTAFSVKWNPDLVHQALLAQLANRRRPLAHAKNRAEVSGGGRKPWRQKGTGRARHGSIRSPLWKGGGVTFGPSKEKIFARKINQKMLHLAALSVLSKKLSDNEVKVVESLKLADRKTKTLTVFLKKFGSFPAGLLLITGDPKNENLFPAGRNLPKTKVIRYNNLNVYDLLRYKNIVMDKQAVKNLWP